MYPELEAVLDLLVDELRAAWAPRQDLYALSNFDGKAPYGRFHVDLCTISYRSVQWRGLCLCQLISICRWKNCAHCSSHHILAVPAIPLTASTQELWSAECLTLLFMPVCRAVPAASTAKWAMLEGFESSGWQVAEAWTWMLWSNQCLMLHV